ncbi:Rieske 2Fe-2S domain-containing protein [Mesorhizobium sp. M0040]|uniref:Rieske (2Fe-2S) protein n=1 Tax=Mesorhizobium sp. M0040 TaxID=2956855 RepID=UPI00333C47EC
MEKLKKVRKVPPKVGEYYLVRTIYGNWLGMLDNWPIIGPKHSDDEYFHLSEDHYHIDVRFTDPKFHTHAEAFEKVILANNKVPVVWRKRMCHASWIYHTLGVCSSVIELNQHYAGQTARAGKSGWICPHKKLSLGEIQPDAFGVITCPLHGLRIDGKTGVCLGPEPREGRVLGVSALKERLAYLEARIEANLALAPAE